MKDAQFAFGKKLEEAITERDTKLTGVLFCNIYFSSRVFSTW